MLNKDELKILSQISTLKSLIYLFQDYLIIGLCFYFVIAFPHPTIYLLAFILISRTQLALGILMHDGAHRRLSPSKNLNDILGQFFISAPLFFSMFSYQKYHLIHHRIPMQENDPDLSLTGGYPLTKKSFYRKVLRDLLGVSYFKFIGYFLYKARKPKKEHRERKSSFDEISKLESFSRPVIALSILLANLFIFSIFYFSGKPWLYFFFWFLPMATGLQFLLRIRGITEHAGYVGDPNHNQEDQAHISRTVVNPLQTFFFAPHHVNYHIEHHLYPGIPHYNLPKTHALLQLRGSIPAKNFYRSYSEVLSELIVSKGGQDSSRSLQDHKT